MGNAVWRGVRLKDVLAKAGLRKEALEIVVNGADGPVIEKTPDFVKSIPLWKALDENTIIAHQMNGQPLPHFNGFPARLIIPGWTATYWMKHLVTIDAVAKPFDGFWVKSAYRIPSGKFPVVQHFLSQMTAANEPITDMVVNSVDRLARQRPAGAGRPAGRDQRRRVGRRLRAKPRRDIGRQWQCLAGGQARAGSRALRLSQLDLFLHAATPGKHTIMANASNVIGQTQAESLIFNPAGYHNNVVARSQSPPCDGRWTMKSTFLAAAIVLAAAAAYAEEQEVTLKDAPGREVVEDNCAACHSLDYLRINSPFMDRKMWQAEVNKMINVIGAPIEPTDAATIVDYLVKNYGSGG